jgi:hypothetical protein
MSAEGIPYLSVRLARLVHDLDGVTQQIEAERVKPADALLLEAPVRHVALVLDTLSELLHRAERVCGEEAS